MPGVQFDDDAEILGIQMEVVVGFRVSNGFLTVLALVGCPERGRLLSMQIVTVSFLPKHHS